MLSRALALGLLCLGLLPTRVHAEWPPNWPFLQSERGWFFYREARPTLQVPSIPSPEPSAEAPDAPTSRAPAPATPPTLEPPPAPQSEQPPEGAEPAPPPGGGPALDAWLLAISDADLERRVPTVAAPALRAWGPILADQALTTLDRRSVRKYLLVHQEILRRADRFAQVWQQVLWTDPAFDRPGGMPMGAMAQALYEEQRATQDREALAALRESVSLLLAIQPSCPACEAQWHLLSAWAGQRGLSVRPIARVLTTLADSTVALPYPEILTALQVTEYPSLYLIEPAQGVVTRVGTGLLSEEDLTTRLLRLAPGASRQGALEYATHLPSPPPGPAAP